MHVQLCLLLFLPLFGQIQSLTNFTFLESGQLVVEADKGGEWSAPVEVPSPTFRLDWIDEECCWKSKMAIELVGLSPPYLSIPFGQMQVGQVIDLRELWHSTLADYRAKMAEFLGGEGMAQGGGEDGHRLEGAGEGQTRRLAAIPSSIRLSANCKTRIIFQH